MVEFERGCGGSLIHPQVVLSVAHCHTLILEGEFAYVGSHKLRKGLRRQVDYVVEHPDYNDRDSRNDILLVVLKEPATNIPLVQLNEDPFVPSVLEVSKQGNSREYHHNRQQTTNTNPSKNDVGELLTVIGFGVTLEGSGYMAPTLQKANVPYVPQSVCQEWYKREVLDEETMFCTSFCEFVVLWLFFVIL